MKRTTLLSSWALIVLLGMLSSATADEQITLELNLEPGQSITVEMLTRQDIDQTVQGQALNMDQTIGLTSLYEVLDRPSASGGYWMRMTYTHCRFKQTGQMGEIDFDSDRDEGEVPLMARGFSGLVGQSLVIEFKPDGEVVTVEGIEVMLEKMIDAMDLPEGPAKDAARQVMEEQFNPESLKQMMAMSAGVYPGKPVGLGDAWDDQQSLAGMVPMTVDSRYTLAGFDDQTASLDVSGQISPQLDAEAFKIDQAQMMTKMDGTQTGKVVLDRQTGWVKSSEMTQNIQGQMTVTPPDADPVKIDMVITSTISLRVVE